MKAHDFVARGIEQAMVPPMTVERLQNLLGCGGLAVAIFGVQR